ncbi:MAG: AmmeMemoRadiSam system protein A [Planctomycetota bacterium]|nr:MAG: AmmeMemoRadiSam system protein A [Planctomycetota bacterium]
MWSRTMSNESAQPDWARYARDVLELALRGRSTEDARPPDDDRPHSGAFVTLYKHNRLRGCVGTLDDRQSRADAVAYAAVAAARQDARFPPVQAAELPEIRVEVSILSPPKPMHSLDDLVLGEHGVIVQRGPQRGLFLPKVATTHGFDKETLLQRCCTEKAGLPPDAWRDPATRVWIFRTESYSEDDR